MSKEHLALLQEFADAGSTGLRRKEMDRIRQRMAGELLREGYVANREDTYLCITPEGEARLLDA